MSNLTQISSQLWEMANKLRGTMDASEYKNYILPFMFYRYLSENQDEYLKENQLEGFYTASEKDKETYLDDISHHIGYAIDPNFTWKKLIENIKNHKIKASDFQDMFDEFNKNVKLNSSSEQDFANVFSDVHLSDTRLGLDTNERAKALNDIIMMINEFTFKDESGRDILGDVYTYLIGQFAANAGKKGGEFYTPHEVSQVLAHLVVGKVDTSDQFHVYDPTMGSGSLLLTVQKELPDGDQIGKVAFYGQEINTTTFNLARMNLMMHGANYQNIELRCGDTLDTDWPYIEKNGIQVPLKFDAVVANPPYSKTWDNKNMAREKDPRFKSFGVAPASKADYAFVLHGLYHLATSGTMAIVLPHGVLFRGGAEGKIRKNIIDENLLDTVIGLPANLFYGTSIPTTILVFKGREARGKNKDILFIDASREFVKEKKQNKLSEDNIHKIIQTYKERKTIDKYSYLASLDEIQKNEYNLNIPRYVDSFESEEVPSLTEVAKELNEVSKEIAETSAKFEEMLSELKGTTPETQKELSEFIKLIKE